MSWSGDLPSTYGEEGSYSFTTSTDDESCITPFGGYLDLKSDINADPDPDDHRRLARRSRPSPRGDFGFYGQSYQGLEFADDGFLVYGDGYGDPAVDEPYAPQVVPDVAKPNGVAAMLWQDMEFRYDLATGAGVTLASTAGTNGFDPGELAIVEFDNMRYWDNDSGSYGSARHAGVGEDSSNDLWFAYDNVTGRSDVRRGHHRHRERRRHVGQALVNARRRARCSRTAWSSARPTTARHRGRELHLPGDGRR